MDNYEYDFSAYSALFNAVDNSIFIRDRLANQVNYIKRDKNGLNLKIRNEKRLINILFNEIQKAYNDRIINYNLNFRMLDSDSDKEKLSIVKFLFTESNDGINTESGYYHVFPRVFRCKKCNHYVALNKSDWEKFNPNKCPHCGGEYTQVSILAFCEQCGIIETVSASCPSCHSTELELNMVEEESPGTWKFICKDCGHPFDFVAYRCKHNQPFSKENICDEDPTPFTFINVRRGGLFKSCVKTTVDVPENEDENDSEYIDEIIIADYFNKWGSLDLEEGKEVSQAKYLMRLLEEFPNKEAREFLGIPDRFEKAELLESMLKSIREEYNKNFSLSNVSDYLILKGTVLQNDSLNISLNDSFDQYYDINYKEYSKFMDKFGIEDITYLPNIQLITSSYGYVKGINKFYEAGFIPHFEPHRTYEGTLKAYSYPYETEGLMFDLDKLKLANWLLVNFSADKKLFTSEEDARNYLFNLDESSEEFEALTKLVHSFSHILIKRSSLYTGLNEDSCGELLFPKVGAFMIYSTSNINIGGFLFVFENSLLEWFDDIEWDVKECIFDPLCMDEEGACFSCMHLPEFVCSHFNKNLDRDVFLGMTERFYKGYW